MLNIAICDDQREVCHIIEGTLLQYAKDNKISIDIEVFYDGDALYDFITGEHGFDLIYLDIEMPALNGLELSRNIRKEQKDWETKIIFVSGTTEYDRQLFDVQPLHFIPKPIDPRLVIEDFDLALKMCGDLSQRYIFQIGRDTYRIPYQQILYFESINRKIVLTTKNATYAYYGQLQKILSTVPVSFCRIHKSYIINFQQVIQFHRDSVTMADGTNLPIGDTYRQSFKEHQREELLGGEL